VKFVEDNADSNGVVPNCNCGLCKQTLFDVSNLSWQQKVEGLCCEMSFDCVYTLICLLTLLSTVVMSVFATDFEKGIWKWDLINFIIKHRRRFGLSGQDFDNMKVSERVCDSCCFFFQVLFFVCR
jgi:hypothetical protein